MNSGDGVISPEDMFWGLRREDVEYVKYMLLEEDFFAKVWRVCMTRWMTCGLEMQSRSRPQLKE